MKEILIIEGAKIPEDIFGARPSVIKIDELKDNFKKKYRLLIKVVHPDHVPDTASPDWMRYDAAFKKVTDFYDKAIKMIDDDSYGKPRPIMTITSKTGQYEIIGPTMQYADPKQPVQWSAAAQFFDGLHKGVKVLVKVSTDPANNKLLKAEAALNAEMIKDVKEQGIVDRFMKIIESFEVVIGGKNRVVTVMEKPGNLMSLGELHECFKADPTNVLPVIHPRHAAWMWRRTLETLMHFEEKGYVFGAAVPSNLLFNPDNHGIYVFDMVHAVKIGSKMETVVSKHKQLYPPEVLSKQPTGHNTDTYIAAKTFASVCTCANSNVVIRTFESYFNAASFSNQGRRTESALELYRRFDDIIHNRMGWKKEFLVLTIKPKSK